MKINTHLSLLLRSRMSGAIPLLPCLNGVDRENFTIPSFFNANDISYLIIFLTTFCILTVCTFIL